MPWVKTIAEMIDGLPCSSAEFFSTDSWRTMAGVTLLLFLDVKTPLPCWEEIATILRHGGRVSSVMIDESIIYLGPLKTSRAHGACPECLRLRIGQRTESIDVEAGTPAGRSSSMSDSTTREIWSIAARMLEYTLSAPGDPNFDGSCWALHTGPLLCTSEHVVQSLRCRLCAALDGVSPSGQGSVL